MDRQMAFQFLYSRLANVPALLYNYLLYDVSLLFCVYLVSCAYVVNL